MGNLKGFVGHIVTITETTTKKFYVEAPRGTDDAVIVKTGKCA